MSGKPSSARKAKMRRAHSARWAQASFYRQSMSQPVVTRTATDEEREQFKARRSERMAGKAPTKRQLRLLSNLGHEGTPASRQEAHDLIEGLLG